LQAWFTDCAYVISGTFSRNVEWETPLGLAVVQPYTKRLGTGILRTGKPELSSIPVVAPDFFWAPGAGFRVKPNSLKQRNGFPPNFVHSLDSTHMMLTSLYLWNAGVTFASVHDCYWTHASSVAQVPIV
jgi:DNA-directed RNA polymerase